MQNYCVQKYYKNLYLVKPLTPKHFHVKPKVNMEMEHLQTTACWKLDNEASCTNYKEHLLLCTLNMQKIYMLMRMMYSMIVKLWSHTLFI